MELKARITEDMKTAMKSGDKEKLATIRLILSAFKQIEVDERIVLDDTRCLAILEKMLKQRRDSISQFEAAARQDLVAKEQSEVAVIEAYMPAKMSEAEIDTVVAATIHETAATSGKDMGKVMAAIKPKLQGKADMQLVSARIKASLGA
jgi:uncharacterized protein